MSPDVSHLAAPPAGPVSNGHVLDTTARRWGRLQPVPDRERRDREALWERLHREGVLYLTDVLDADQVRNFRRIYFTELAPSGLCDPSSPPVEGVQGTGPVDRGMLRHALFERIVPGEAYEALCTMPAIRQFYEWFLGGPVMLHRRRIIRHVRTDDAFVTPAHYDLVYLRHGTDRVYTSWIPLGNCPPQRSGLLYLEGSHRFFRSEDGTGGHRYDGTHVTVDLPALAEKLDSRWLWADYRVGDMVVHSPYAVHAALDNADPGRVMRLSTDIRYQLRSEPADQRWTRHWRDDDGL